MLMFLSKISARRIGVVFLTVAVLASCSMVKGVGKKQSPAKSPVKSNVAAKVSKAKTALIPAPRPSYKVGDSYVFRSKGKLSTHSVTGVSITKINWKDDQGQTWVTTRNPYLLALKEADVIRKYSISAYSLFPMLEDRYARFVVVKIQSGKKPKTLTQTCQVTDSRKVKVEAGEFDTYEIFCRRTEYFETLYYAPKIGHVVLSVRERLFKKNITQLVSYEPAVLAKKSDMPKPAVVIPPTNSKVMTPQELLADKKESADFKAKPMADLSKVPDVEKPRIFGVQIAAFRTIRGAKRAFTAAFVPAAPDLLRGVKIQYRDYFPPDGSRKFIRIMVGEFKNSSQARKLCRQLKARKMDCWVHDIK